MTPGASKSHLMINRNRINANRQGNERRFYQLFDCFGMIVGVSCNNMATVLFKNLGRLS